MEEKGYPPDQQASSNGPGSTVVVNFKGNRDGDLLSPDVDDAQAGMKNVPPQTQQQQRPPLKSIMKKPGVSSGRRVVIGQDTTDESSGTFSGEESETEEDEEEDSEITSNKIPLPDILQTQISSALPIPPPPRNLTIELPLLFRILLFFNGTEFPIWFSITNWGFGLWGRGGGGPWDKGRIASVLQYIWTLLIFLVVAFVTIMINVDIYFEFRTYGLPVQFATIPVPLLVLCMNYYFQRTNSFQGLMKLLNSASTSYISEALARKKHRKALERNAASGGLATDSDSQADYDDDDDDIDDDFREDSFLPGPVTRYTIHIRKAKKRASARSVGIHNAIGGDQKRRRKPVRDPRTVAVEKEVGRRVPNKKWGVMVQAEDVEVGDDGSDDGEDTDLLPGEEGKVWYSQPVLDSAHVFTLRFFSVAAFVLAVVATAASILSILVPFVSNHSDNTALVIANYIVCGLIFWWHLVLFSFIGILFAISALVIRFVKTVIYVQKLGRATLQTTIGYLQQLDKVIMRAALQLQWPLGLCLLSWSAGFVVLEYAYFFQPLIDRVSLYIVIPAQYVLPIFIFLLLKPASDITHSFARCRVILFRWATKHGRTSTGEAQVLAYQDMAIIRHLLAKSGWYIFGVALTRKMLVLYILVTLSVLGISAQHVIHLQLADRK